MHPILFEIGPFSVYSYGVLVAAGFLLGSFFIIRDATRAGFEREVVLDGLFAMLAGGIIGGRLLFVIVNWRYYIDAPGRIFALTEGGMAIQGAVVLAVAAGVVTARMKRVSFWRAADIFIPYVALGQAIGRIGCFLNGCCYGKVYEGPLSVTFPHETVSRIPAQLYSSLGLFVIFIVLKMIKRSDKAPGRLFALYLIIYSVFRIFMDLLRGDNPRVFYSLTLAQVISAGMLLAGIALLCWVSRHERQGSFTV